MTAERRRGVRVRCPIGGYTPCFDDMCHSGGTTICGLDPDYDVCPHGYIPETCTEGCSDELDDDDFGDVDFDDDGRYVGG